MDRSDIRWNDEARKKILSDADGVLQDAVLELAASMNGADYDSIFRELNRRLKDRFIDYEPGPDLVKYTEAIQKGEIEVSPS